MYNVSTIHAPRRFSIACWVSSLVPTPAGSSSADCTGKGTDHREGCVPGRRAGRLEVHAMHSTELQSHLGGEKSTSSRRPNAGSLDFGTLHVPQERQQRHIMPAWPYVGIWTPFRQSWVGGRLSHLKRYMCLVTCPASLNVRGCFRL